MKNGTSALQQAFDQAKKDGEAFAKAAKESYRTDADALNASLSQLGTALQNIKTNGTQPVVTAAQSVQTSAKTLVDKVNTNSCH